MLRMMPRSLAAAASFGRCSLIRSPGTAVAVSLEGPPFLWSGLRSQVSVWLGPPDIHRTMHALAGFLSAAAASVGSHGQAAAPNALARLMRTKSRRLKSRAFMGPPPFSVGPASRAGRLVPLGSRHLLRDRGRIPDC